MIGMWNKPKFLKGTILDISMILAIVISIVLTGFVFSSFGQNEAPDSATSQQSEQQLLELIQPTQLIVTHKDGSQQLVTHKISTQIKKIRTYIEGAELNDAKSEKVSVAKIQSLLSIKKSQILRYPDVVPISYFNTRYQQNVSSGKNFNFNYFVLDFNRSNIGYFVNTKTNRIVTVKVKKLNNDLAWQKAEELPTTVAVNFKAYQGQVMMNYPNDVKLPVYSYLLNHRDPSAYVSALLGTINQLSISKADDRTIYTNKLNSQKIVYNSTLETVTFEDHNAKNQLPKTYLGRLNAGLSQINLLQLNLADTRFYESRDNGQQVTYRTYVEGFPVYFQSESGAIRIKIADNGDLTSTYSLNELGVPVPNKQEDVTLPSTTSILKQLDDAGVKKSDYYFITPGYEWLINKDSQAAVNMEPTWMIETSSGWQSVSAFLKHHDN